MRLFPEFQLTHYDHITIWQLIRPQVWSTGNISHNYQPENQLRYEQR